MNQVVMLEQADIQSLGHLLLSLSLCATFTPQMEKVGGERGEEEGGGGGGTKLGIFLHVVFSYCFDQQNPGSIMSVLYDS